MQTIKKNSKPIEILLAEDEPNDQKFIKRAFDKSNYLVNLQIVNDGVEAMEYLLHQGKYQNSIRPHMILLDINMPRKNGKEVLHEVKTNPDLKRIPVAMLTSSPLDEDIFKSYDSGANCYIHKPPEPADLSKVVASLEEFWFSTVTLSTK
jgi:CheY-like chemotaxis protein